LLIKNSQTPSWKIADNGRAKTASLVNNELINLPNRGNPNIGNPNIGNTGNCGNIGNCGNTVRNV